MFNKITLMTKGDKRKVLTVLYLNNNKKAEKNLDELGEKLARQMGEEICIGNSDKTFSPNDFKATLSKKRIITTYYKRLKRIIADQAKKLANNLIGKLKKENVCNEYMEKIEKKKKNLLQMRNKVEEELEIKKAELKTS